MKFGPIWVPRPLDRCTGDKKNVFPVLGQFWRFFVSGVGGNDSWDLFHPQCTCPEVGGPKSDQISPIWRVPGRKPCILRGFRSMVRGGGLRSECGLGAAGGRGRGGGKAESCPQTSQPGRPQRGLADCFRLGAASSCVGQRVSGGRARPGAQIRAKVFLNHDGLHIFGLRGLYSEYFY